MERSPYESCDVVSTIRNWKWLSFHVFAGFFFWVLGVECVRGRWTNHVGLLLLSLSLSKKKHQKKINQSQIKREKNYHGKKSLWIMRCSFHSLKLKMSVISLLLHRQCIDLFTWKSCHIFSEKRIESFFWERVK